MRLLICRYDHVRSKSMGGIRDVVDDMKFEAWLRTCAAMSPEAKRKRLSQIESSNRKRSAAAEERA